ncbi:glycosomal membrane protein [Trypanosoma rangeli]|uniref:Glycosomal membrane protein n=1 Tax=Trypanosoma rangeli TaxID=5698 RepID=A0A422P470_TRYRA|nr:glycosomal membrane protein [Trypanosoma rangeli]RNF12475.1 glycosomal membrane protein [Trypanosoma rangeli]|eukprot:RNF12475.1 glycosomal membrane protein [Trypanosoma rangeli]
MQVEFVFVRSAHVQDKMLRSAVAVAKLFWCLVRDKSYLNFADTASEVGSFIRMFSWLSNLRTFNYLLNKEQPGVRDVIFLIHVLAEGVFKLADNVAFIGRKLYGSTPLFQQAAYISRLGLFLACLAAVGLSLFDIRHSRLPGSRRKQLITLFQGVCDLLTAAAEARVAGFELSCLWSSLLTLLSSLLWCVNGFRSAATSAKHRAVKCI